MHTDQSTPLPSAYPERIGINALKFSVSLLLALIVNVMLVYLIHSLVRQTDSFIVAFKTPHLIELVGINPKPKLLQNKPKITTPQMLEDSTEPRQPLKLELPEQARPSLSRLEVPEFKLKLPGSLIGDPYIGNFQSNPEVLNIQVGEPIRQIPPSYPPKARQAGIEGSVLVEFTIAIDGSVKAPKIIEANPPNVFNRAVLRAIRRWRFNPRVIDGKAVEQRAKKQIIFELKER